MQNLMCFNGNKVDIIVEDGKVLFELYSTGVALGQIKKNTMGRIYPRRDRIDENVKNAEITPCVRNGHKFLTEEQLYDLMLEVKTEQVKPFRKWLVREVLPSINRTGSYSMTTQQPDPTLTPKYYNGEPVVTLRDIEAASGICGYNIRPHIYKLSRGVDYYLLEGQELARFKAQNPSVGKLTSSIIVINRRGFIKLMKHVQDIPMLDCFKNALPEPKTESKYKRPLCVDVPDNNKFQKAIQETKKKTIGLLALLDQLNMYAFEENHLAICRTIYTMGVRLSTDCYAFKDMQYGYSDKPM